MATPVIVPCPPSIAITMTSVDSVRSNASEGWMKALFRKYRPPAIAGRKAEAL